MSSSSSQQHQRGRGQLERLRRSLFRHQWNRAESLIRHIPSKKILPNIHVDQERWSVLHIAVMVSAPVRLVDKLLNVVDVEFCMQKDANGNNPLHKLLYKNKNNIGSNNNNNNNAVINVELATCLIVAYPRAFHQENDEDHKTPLDMLLSSSSSSSVITTEPQDIASLIVSAARAWPEGMYSTHGQRGGTNLLHTVMAYCSKTTDGAALTVAGTILEAAPELLERTDENEDTPLHYAVRQKEQHTADLVDFLTTYGEQQQQHCGALDLRNALERTPLHEACAVGAKRDVIEILVSRYPDALVLEDSAGMVPLALFRKHYRKLRSWSVKNETLIAEAAMTLVSGVPVRCSDSSPPPSLHTFLNNPTHQCTMDVTRFVVSALSDQASLHDDDGNLPLHVVCSTMMSPTTATSDHVYLIDVIERLLNAYPAACKIPNNDGILPLQLMARSGHAWSRGMRLVFLLHPAAVVDLGLNSHALCALLEKIGAESTPNVMFDLLRNAPDLFCVREDRNE